MQIKGVNHVTILVKDKKKAEDFYCNTLGLEKVEFDGHLWVRTGEQFVHISENSGKPLPRGFYHFALEVYGLRDYLQTLIDRGVPVFEFDKNNQPININKDLEKGGRCYFVNDPDNNLIELIDSKSKFFHR